VMMLWWPTGESYARERITVFVRGHGFAKCEGRVEFGRRICKLGRRIFKRWGTDWRRAAGVRFANRRDVFQASDLQSAGGLAAQGWAVEWRLVAPLVTPGARRGSLGVG